MDKTEAWYFVNSLLRRRTGSSAMRSEKMEQAAEARRGVRAMVRWGEMRMIFVLVLGGERDCARVQPAQPVPRIKMVC